MDEKNEHGFGRKLEADEIIDVTEEGGELLFLVKWFVLLYLSHAWVLEYTVELYTSCNI